MDMNMTVLPSIAGLQYGLNTTHILHSIHTKNIFSENSDINFVEIFLTFLGL